jgi:hypothetical protein
MQLSTEVRKRQSTTVTYHGLRWPVSGVYTRGRPAKPYLTNGDPGYPAEPSELEDIAITLRQAHGESDELSDILNDDAQNKLIELALENMDDPDFGSDDDIPFRGEA